MESVTALDGLAEQLSRGEPLPEGGARAILESYDLITIGMMGDDVRRRMHGARTTFVRVFEVHAGAVPPELPAGVEAGEFRVVGRPETAAAAIESIRAARALSPAVPLTGFTLADVREAAAGGFAPFCRELRAAGLDAIAAVDVGRAGERTDDLAAAIRDARAAGLAVSRMTVDGVAADRRLEVVEAARDLQAAAGGFAAFAPLSRTLSPAEPTTGFDDVKLIVLARLVAANVPSIQVDWALYGPKLAQVGLTVGADDVDGVAAFDPGTLGARRSVLEEIRRHIRAASLEPVERDAHFAAR